MFLSVLNLFYFILLSDKGPQNVRPCFLHVWAVHQLFIFRFVFQNCVRSTQRLLHYVSLYRSHVMSRTHAILVY